MLKKFEVTCKECGSTDVGIMGYCGQNYGEGVLYCNNCDNEESSTENDD